MTDIAASATAMAMVRNRRRIDHINRPSANRARYLTLGTASAKANGGVAATARTEQVEPCK